MEFLTQNNNTAFILLMLFCFLIARIPYIGRYFKVVNTLVHEAGHTLMALLTDGKVVKVELFSDTSGTTITQSKSKTGQFLIALAGYPIATATAYFLMYLIFNKYFSAVLIIMVSVAIIKLLFFIRNTQGIVWSLSFIILLGLNFLYGTKNSTTILALVVSGIVFFEALWSSFVIMILSFKTPKKAGDTSILSGTSFIPAWIWGTAFFAFSVFVSFKVVNLYLDFNFAELSF